MEQKGNFDETIHVVDYKAGFEKFKTGSFSLMAVEGRDKESLAGRWNFISDPYETILRSSWYKEERLHRKTGLPQPLDYDFEKWPLMDVPSCWNMKEPELFLYENMCIYFRTFTIERKEDERLFLDFEGVSYRAYVFLNGACIAVHDGASTPFFVEITDSVRTENRLIVAVEAVRSDQRVPMSNTDWFNYGGIYREVFIYRVPQAFIKDYFVRLVPDSGFSRIAVDVTVDGRTEGVVACEIPELGIRTEIPLVEGKGSVELEAQPVLWSPMNPKLYEVDFSFEKDSISDRIGFREIRREGRSILLNGKEIFLKGISLHEDHPKLGKSTNEEVIRDTIECVKNDLNGNFLRLAHYPHSRLFAKLADEMGILLWEEIPVYWAIDFENRRTYEDAENQLSELVLRDRNRASVIIWSVGNENPDTDARYHFMSSLAAFTRRMDATRLVSAACLVNKEKEMIEDRLASCLDIIGINEYYGWYEPDFSRLQVIMERSDPDKPVIITEFGGGALAGHHGPKQEMWTEEYQQELYRNQVATISACSYIKGMTPWILYDFRAPRRLNLFQNGYNRKGLISDDRKTRKLAFRVLSDFYSMK